MKMTEELKKAQANLVPGAIVEEGFLGHDRRPLADIIQHDEEAFAEHGLSWDAVAERLKYLLAEGEKGLGEPVTVEGKWRVFVYEARGQFACPWEDGLFHKDSVTVQRLENGHPVGDRLVFNQLCIHMLEKHHFLEGLGSSFRLHPAALRNVLNL